MDEVLVVNPKLESNAKKYLEWRPPSLATDIDIEINMQFRVTRPKANEWPPLPVLIASILRSPTDKGAQQEWVHRIARDLGLEDMPAPLNLRLRKSPIYGSKAPPPQFGLGWNGRMFRDLVKRCKSGELELYMLDFHARTKDPLYLSNHFFFSVKSPFNLLNWDENPLEVKE